MNSKTLTEEEMLQDGGDVGMIGRPPNAPLFKRKRKTIKKYGFIKDELSEFYYCDQENTKPKVEQFFMNIESYSCMRQLFKPIPDKESKQHAE